MSASDLLWVVTKETHLLVILHHILPNPLFVFLQELTFHWLLTDRTGKWLGLFSWSHDNKHGSQFPLMFRLGGCQFTSKRPVSAAPASQIVNIMDPVLRKISHILGLDINEILTSRAVNQLRGCPRLALWFAFLFCLKCMSRWSSNFFFPVASSEKRRPDCLHRTVRFRKSSSKSGLYL